MLLFLKSTVQPIEPGFEVIFVVEQEIEVALAEASNFLNSVLSAKRISHLLLKDYAELGQVLESLLELGDRSYLREL